MAVVRRRLVAALAELLEQIRSQVARIGKLLEFDARELLQFCVGVIGAALLANALPDLLHDLLDINGVRSDV
jgi:hypothetical protein